MRGWSSAGKAPLGQAGLTQRVYPVNFSGPRRTFHKSKITWTCKNLLFFLWGSRRRLVGLQEIQYMWIPEQRGLAGGALPRTFIPVPTWN